MSPLHESSLEEKGQPSLSNVAIDTVETTLSPEEDARIRRKIDWNLLPLLSLIYGLQFVSASSVAYSMRGARDVSGPEPRFSSTRRACPTPSSWGSVPTRTSPSTSTPGSEVSSVSVVTVTWLCAFYWNQLLIRKDLGYLVGEYPLSFALQKLPMAKMTGFNIIVWGVVLSLISVAQNFSHLMVLRL